MTLNMTEEEHTYQTGTMAKVPKDRSPTAFLGPKIRILGDFDGKIWQEETSNGCNVKEIYGILVELEGRFA